VWAGSSPGLSGVVAGAVRSVLAGAPSGAEMSVRGQAALIRCREERPWVREGTTTVVASSEGPERWWTFAGLLANADLAARLGSTDFDSLQIRLPADLAGRDPRTVVARSPEPTGTWDRLAGDLKFAECLPLDLRRRAAASRMTDAASIAERLAEPLGRAGLSGAPGGATVWGWGSAC